MRRNKSMKRKCHICKKEFEKNIDFEKYCDENTLKEIVRQGFGEFKNLEPMDTCESCSEKFNSFFKELGDRKRLLTKQEVDKLKEIMENKKNN